MSTPGKAPPIRRVATGQAANGLSVIVSDEEVGPVESPLMPGANFYSFWGADGPLSLPNDGTEPPFRTWFPPDGGFRFELKLDSGEATPLRTGDTLIQTGSRHAWGNPGRVPCALLVVSIGAKRKG